MSIHTDRQELYQALQKMGKIEGKTITANPYTLEKVEAYKAYIELAGLSPAEVFTKIQITWDVIITASARLSPQSAIEFLDKATNAAISAVIGSSAADFQSVEQYFILTDNSSGGSIPATRITFTSQTAY